MVFFTGRRLRQHDRALRGRHLVLGLAALGVGLRPDIAAAQNLVINPSFEVHAGVPTTLSQLNLAVGWDSPTGASPDYYLAGAPSLVDVPANSLGNQSAHSGQAYAGIHARPVNDYREYVEAPLISPLVAGQTYQVSFYLSLVDQSRWAVDRFGAYLSVGPVGPIANALPLPLTPQITNPIGNVHHRQGQLDGRQRASTSPPAARTTSSSGTSTTTPPPRR